MELSGYTYVYSGSFLFLCIFDTIYISSDRIYKDAAKNGYKMSRPNVQKILYKNVQLVCLS